MSMKMKSIFMAIIALALMTAPLAAAGTPVKGGVLKIAIDSDPPTLDVHSTRATLALFVAGNMYEGLYAFTKKGEIKPMLASGMPVVSDDKLTHTISLRQDIEFHNGKPMTSADVAASLNRWGKVASYGKQLFAHVDTVTARDKYTIAIQLKEKWGTLMTSLAMMLGGPVIYPEEICTKYPAKPSSEYIGTGPYMFVEWRPNDHITLKRFEGYKALDTESTGYTGRKTAYLDELVFYGISEETVRVNGVEGREYDFADFVPSDEYDRLKDVKHIKTYISPPRAWFVFVLNTKYGPTKNKKVRQAMLATMDVKGTMAAGYGDQLFWRVDPSLALKEQVWHSTAGEAAYNQNNIEKAKVLLKEAGYKGEKIVWMSGPLEYNLSVAAKVNMVKAGLNIDLQSMEWATLLSRRKNPELWSTFSSGFTAKADPSLATAMNLKYGAGWDHPEAKALFENLCNEPEFEARHAILSKFQELVYSEVPYIKVGDYKNLRISNNKVQGFANDVYLYFFNVWKEK